jgi:hypothetical protein
MDINPILINFTSSTIHVEDMKVVIIRHVRVVQSRHITCRSVPPFLLANQPQ